MPYWIRTLSSWPPMGWGIFEHGMKKNELKNTSNFDVKIGCAFQVSGLLKHQSNAEVPLKYSHMDVAGSSGDLPEPTSASTVIGLSMHFFQ